METDWYLLVLGYYGNRRRTNAVHIAKWNFASQYFTQAIIDKELEK